MLTRAQNVVNAVVMAALSGPFYAGTYYALGFTMAAQEILLCCAFMFTSPFLLRATGSIFIAREVFLCAVFSISPGSPTTRGVRAPLPAG
jgi:hypothetical protein